MKIQETKSQIPVAAFQSAQRLVGKSNILASVGTRYWQAFLPLIEIISHLCLQAIVLCISMLTFVRNRATNVLPLVLGLFFKIGGTGVRVINMLSNAGICVSFNTIERLKSVISDDAISRAVALLTSGEPCFLIFDNINLYLRKSQQRIHNKNTILNVTNAAVIGLSNVEDGFDNLKSKLDLRGKRAQATINDILPTREDDERMMDAFAALIARLLVAYTPGNEKWKDRKEMEESVKAMIREDRPLPPKKMDACPFGVFNVDKGTKKGNTDVQGNARAFDYDGGAMGSKGQTQ